MSLDDKLNLNEPKCYLILFSMVTITHFHLFTSTGLPRKLIGTKHLIASGFK